MIFVKKEQLIDDLSTRFLFKAPFLVLQDEPVVDQDPMWVGILCVSHIASGPLVA